MVSGSGGLGLDARDEPLPSGDWAESAGRRGPGQSPSSPSGGGRGGCRLSSFRSDAVAAVAHGGMSDECAIGNCGGGCGSGSLSGRGAALRLADRAALQHSAWPPSGRVVRCLSDWLLGQCGLTWMRRSDDSGGVRLSGEVQRSGGGSAPLAFSFRPAVPSAVAQMAAAAVPLCRCDGDISQHRGVTQHCRTDLNGGAASASIMMRSS